MNAKDWALMNRWIKWYLAKEKVKNLSSIGDKRTFLLVAFDKELREETYIIFLVRALQLQSFNLNSHALLKQFVFSVWALNTEEDVKALELEYFKPRNDPLGIMSNQARTSCCNTYLEWTFKLRPWSKIIFSIRNSNYFWKLKRNLCNV